MPILVLLFETPCTLELFLSIFLVINFRVYDVKISAIHSTTYFPEMSLKCSRMWNMEK